MAIVERGNAVLEIADDDVQRYIDKGFSLTDGHGNIIQRAIPNNVGELQRLVIKQQQEIDQLKAKIKEFTTIPEEPEVVIEPKPKRGRRKKSEE